MADPEVPAPKKPKRKRSTALPDPEEITETIVNQLMVSRDGIDKELAKYNKSFMRTQSGKRQQFIDYCRSRLIGLPRGMRSLVATRLLSSEDFSVEMNFSEVRTANVKSSLTWSCADASLSDLSWRTLLQQYAVEFSSPRAGKLARTTRVTSKSASPAAPALPPISEPTSVSNSMALSEADVDTDKFTEDEEDSDDPISTLHVTMLRKTRARNDQQLGAPPDPLSPKGRPGPDSKQATPKKRNPPYWSKKECDTLISLCSNDTEAQRQPVSDFWIGVQAQLPGRSQYACWQKWIKLRGKSHKPRGNSNNMRGKSHKTRTTGHVVHKKWSPEELVKLEQLRPQPPPPGKPVDWAKVASHFPGRSRQSCESKFRRTFGYRHAYPKTRSEAQSLGDGMPGTEADGIDGELVQENMAPEEAEGDNESS